MTELALSSLILYFKNNYFKEATFNMCCWTVIKEPGPRCPIETQKGMDELFIELMYSPGTWTNGDEEEPTLPWKAKTASVFFFSSMFGFKEKRSGIYFSNLIL